MIDRIFSAALTFCLLIAGTLAIGSAWFGMDRAAPPAHPAASRTSQVSAAQTRVIELPRVVVIGRRLDTAAHLAQNTSAEPSAPIAE